MNRYQTLFRMWLKLFSLEYVYVSFVFNNCGIVRSLVALFIENWHKLSGQLINLDQVQLFSSRENC